MEFLILQGIIAEVLSVDPKEIKLETKFVHDLAADSLDLYQIVMSIEEEFKILITNDDVADIKTVGEALKLVQKK